MPLHAIAGSQGSGKSTTIAALPEFQTITRKTSRSILSDWNVSLSNVNNDRALTIRFQDEILKRKIEDEKHAAESDDIWLTERTYADLFTYALIALGKDNEYSDWIDEYYLKCKEAQQTYEHVFYLTAGHFAPVSDGVRGSNKHYSRLADLVMYDYTKHMSSGRLVTIDVANLERRVAGIREALYPQTKQ